MKNSILKSLVVVILLMLYILSCEKRINDGPFDDHPGDTIIQISYLVDNSKTVSASINPVSGGSVRAEDSYGVSFELILPPGSLQSTTTISMTPFKSFSISGAGSSSCKSCGSTNKDCCHRGVMLGPSGLKLDSSAILVIRYPANVDFPFQNNGLIVYVDSSSNIYSSYKTVIDINARTLTAKINHFSGYGTDETTKDRLKRDIIETCRRLGAKVGSDNFYWECGELERLHWLDGFEGPNGERYDDLVALLEKLSLQLWSKQVAWESERSSGKESCDAIQKLGGADYSLNKLIGWHNGSDFASLRTSIRNKLSTAIRLALDKGISLCKMDSCQAGNELLSCARSAYIGSGFEDLSLIEALNTNLANCCKAKITLTTNNASIKIAALDRNNISECYAVLTAIVTGADGKPKENVGIWFGCDEPNSAPDGGTTDADGKVKTLITGYNAGSIDDNGYSERIFVAHASMGGEEILSEPVTISFKMPWIDFSIEYIGSFIWKPDQIETTNVSINGKASRMMGTSPSPYTCTSGITRSYRYTYSDEWNTVESNILPEYVEFHGCPFDEISHEQLLIPNSNYKYVYYIKAINFQTGSIFLFSAKACSNLNGCTIESVSYPYEILPYGFENRLVTFENNGSGIFPPYNWSNEVTGNIINAQANLNVSVNIRF